MPSVPPRTQSRPWTAPPGVRRPSRLSGWAPIPHRMPVGRRHHRRRQPELHVLAVAGQVGGCRCTGQCDAPPGRRLRAGLHRAVCHPALRQRRRHCGTAPLMGGCRGGHRHRRVDRPRGLGRAESHLGRSRGWVRLQRARSVGAVRGSGWAVDRVDPGSSAVRRAHHHQAPGRIARFRDVGPLQCSGP